MIYMQNDKSLTPRQQANAFYQQGFTWAKACDLARYDEYTDMKEQLKSWAICAVAVAALILIFI